MDRAGFRSNERRGTQGLGRPLSAAPSRHSCLSLVDGLWWMEGSRSLRSAARSAIADPRNEVVLSIASLWELTIKSTLGKLRFPADPGAGSPKRGLWRASDYLRSSS